MKQAAKRKASSLKVMVSAFSIVVRLGDDISAGYPELYPIPDKWDVAAAEILNQLLELLQNDAEVKELTVAKDKECLVVSVRDMGFGADRAIVDLADTRGRLKRLTTEALSQDTAGESQGILVEDAVDSGQLFATVVLHDDLNAAIAFVKESQRGAGMGVIEWDDTPAGQMAALRDVVRHIFAELPANYDAKRATLAAVNDVVREQTAKTLEEAINKEAQNAGKHPQETYEEKKELAKWVNAELRRFGLALKVEGTDARCLVMANTGGQPGKGRFAFYYTDDAGKRHDVFSPGVLPVLKLALDELTRASYGGRTGRSR